MEGGGVINFFLSVVRVGPGKGNKKDALAALAKILI